MGSSEDSKKQYKDHLQADINADKFLKAAAEAEYHPPSVDEILNSIQHSLSEARHEAENVPLYLDTILQQFQDFLDQRPSPPQEWQERVGAQADKYDYHQIVLPDSLCDPYLDEPENIERLRNHWSGTPFMALEAQLILRNKFLWLDGHAEQPPAPRPLLQFESIPEHKELDWDCALTLYPDGSWWTYNMDQEDSEDLGIEAELVFSQYQDLLPNMQLIPPTEGYDFGILKA